MAVRLWIDSIRFNGGDEVKLRPGSILVVVGPNNAGKSALLRELHARAMMPGTGEGPICENVRFGQEGTTAEFMNWVEENFEKRQRLGDSEPSFWGFEQTLSEGTLRHVWELGDGAILGGLKGAVCALADASSRLNVAIPPAAINFATDAISHPIHHLYIDEGAERSLSAAFRTAFGQDLVVHRCAGSSVPLMCGDAPTPAAGQDRLSMPYLRSLSCRMR